MILHGCCSIDWDLKWTSRGAVGVLVGLLSREVLLSFGYLLCQYLQVNPSFYYYYYSLIGEVGVVEEIKSTRVIGN